MNRERANARFGEADASELLADEEARQILQSQAWPSPSTALLARLGDPALGVRRRPAFHERAALALVVALVAAVVGGSARLSHFDQRPATFGGPLGGRLLFVTPTDHALVAVDPDSGERVSLGSVSVPANGFVAAPESLFLSLSPNREAVAIIELVQSDLPPGFRLAVRSLAPEADPIIAAVPSGDRMPTTFTWSPDGRALMYIATVYEAGALELARAATPVPGTIRPWVEPAAFELHIVGFGQDAGGGLSVLADDTVWRADAAEIDAVSADVVGWDPASGRAAVITHLTRSEDRPADAVLLLVDTGRRVVAGRLDLGSRTQIEEPSPNGRWLAHVECSGGQGACDAPEDSVWLIEISTARVVRIPTAGAGWQAGLLAWSPNGTALAWREKRDFSAQPDEPPQVARAIRLIRAAGDGFDDLVTLTETEPAVWPLAFSPDGARLLVARGVENADHAVEDRGGIVAYSLAASGAAEPQPVPDPGGAFVGWIMAH